ncbi:COP9 signalosome complex subunit 7a [Dispira parvispora]|uniref:COP9 signalosome complex subunit 7a n=1 Tax=Dispira parvispora TaxID=1520584 RepID=A0A9W8AZI4_9FUNG|nr:COP9 signalosome complex subunit 7a [Dispira parvispora]
MSTPEVTQNTRRQWYVDHCGQESTMNLVQLLEQALVEPGLYQFAELLALPTVQKLQNDPATRPLYQLVNLFTYGTYQDYTERKGDYPELTPNQLHKLKQLSVMTAAAGKQVLPYAELQSSLEISEPNALEDLLISTLDDGLVHGKLDHRQHQLLVDSVEARDVAPNSENLTNLSTNITHWLDKTNTMLQTLDSVIETLTDRQQLMGDTTSSSKSPESAQSPAHGIDEEAAQWALQKLASLT